MNPVLIFQHSPTEGPGYFTTFLDHAGIPWKMARIDADEAVPDSLDGVAGLCLMGGAMSVNDDLPWIPPLLTLIRDAIDRGIPVIGHCLGGQLMSRALGGTVSANPVKEFGWGEVRVTDPDSARPWLGDTLAAPAFHWHGETFSVPERAHGFLASDWCPNQAWSLDGRHLAMQCHVEMTPEMIATWYAHNAEEVAASTSPGVQREEPMLADMASRINALHGLADKIYSRWIQGLTP